MRPASVLQPWIGTHTLIRAEHCMGNRLEHMLRQGGEQWSRGGSSVGASRQALHGWWQCGCAPVPPDPPLESKGQAGNALPRAARAAPVLHAQQPRLAATHAGSRPCGGPPCWVEGCFAIRRGESKGRTCTARSAAAHPGGTSCRWSRCWCAPAGPRLAAPPAASAPRPPAHHPATRRTCGGQGWGGRGSKAGDFGPII